MKPLQRSFSRKEKLESALSNLDDMKNKGEVDDEQYDSMKDRYASFLAEAKADIEQIKEDVQSQISEQENVLTILEQDKKNLNVRFKVGELQADQYQKEDQKAQKKLQNCQAKISELRKLAESSSSSDVGGYVDVPIDQSAAKGGVGRVTLPSLPSLGGGSWSFGKWSIGLSPGKRAFHIAAGVLLCVYAFFNIFGSLAEFGRADLEDMGSRTKTGIMEMFGSLGPPGGSGVARMRAEARRERQKANTKRMVFYAMGILFLALAGLNITAGVGLFAASNWAAKLAFLTAISGLVLDVANNFLAGFGPSLVLYLAINGFVVFACMDNQ